jgi:uncharacterized protein (DUF885 family)
MKRSGFHAMLAITTLCISLAQAPGSSVSQEMWIERSNENAGILLEVLARFNPEFAGRWGIEGLDEEIFQLPLDLNERNVTALEEAIRELERRRSNESHPAARQDIDILIEAADQQIEGIRINEEYLLPYFDLPQAIFQGIRALLDDQVPSDRHAAALVRLNRYTGLADGYTSLSEQAIAFMRADFDKNLLGPFKDDIEKDLTNSDRFVTGVEQLFQKYDIAGYEMPYAEFKKQMASYEEFMRSELLPCSRDDFRLPKDVYAFNLKGVGIDMPVDELTSRAKVSFREIQNELQAIAELLASERGYPSSDYRDVIRELKKEQLVGDAILTHYRERVKELETLIEANEVVTLPSREMRIRLASEAESAAIPAPSMRPPRMIGNTGELGEFVLPLRVPGKSGEDEVSFDDFTFGAASWTLTVHEGRPGHEMQFASMVETGVSQARVLFAFNSVNVEGWALYCEAEMKPLMPLDGQLIALQHRLLRAARAFLDPGLQLGMISREEAYRILENDVVMSNAMALQEVERYTYRAPGQATSYYCGYTRLMELRTEAERLLGDRFDRKTYHDFILSQGLLPPRLMWAAVVEEFVPARRAAAD